MSVHGADGSPHEASEGGVGEAKHPLRRFPQDIEARQVLVLLVVCLFSFVNQLASYPLFTAYLYNPILPLVPTWTSVPISLREVIFAACLIWCDLNRDSVSDQLVQWHRDYAHYRRATKLNRRAKDLQVRMSTKGLWGKLKLMRSEYMRMKHESAVLSSLTAARQGEEGVDAAQAANVMALSDEEVNQSFSDDAQDRN